MEARTPRIAARASAPPTGTGVEADLYRAMLEPGDPERILGEVLTILCPQLGFDWAGLLLRQDAGGSLVTTWNRSGPADLIRPGSPFAAAEGLALLDLPGTACESALPVDWGRPLTQDLWERGMHRVLYVPLGGSGAGAGPALLIGKSVARAFRARGRGLLEAVARPLGRILDASERERELERRVEERARELSVLYDISRSAGRTLGYEDLVRLIVESLHSLLDFDLAAVLLDLPGARELSVHLARPVSDGCRSEAAALVRNAFRQFAGRPAGESPLVTRMIAEFEPEAALVQGRMGSHQAAALLRRGEVAGAVVVLRRGEGAFTESGVRLLHTIANQASLTLDRLRTLQEAEEGRVQAIIDSMPQGVIMTDASLSVSFANPAARRTLETLAGGVLPATLTDLGGVSVEEIARPVLTGGRPSASAEIRLDDPRRIYSVSVSPVADARGAADRPAGIVILLTDVTEARMMQEQFQQSEKLSAVGEMISGVAHELNNPLASVMGFAQLLQNAPVSEDVRRKLQIIYSESQRCQRVVQNLLSFARKHRPERRAVDVNAVLGSVLALLSYQLRVEGIEVRTSLDTSLPSVQGDFHLLQQVFLNIISNAHQAMRTAGRGGRLEVHTLRHEHEPGGPGQETAAVRIEVRDTGPGISPENLKRVFDPFFTTKEQGQGTGLGLSLAYGAVKEHLGDIYARSTLGKGTTFVVDLPIGAPQAALDEHARSEAQPPERLAPRSILVVEDELLVADLLIEALSGDGHSVASASNGAEALERIRQQDYDLIICDLKMPKMDGRQLFEKVREIRPALARRMIFSTGDVASLQTQVFLDVTGAPCIVKPFDLQEVRRALGRVLRRD